MDGIDIGIARPAQLADIPGVELSAVTLFPEQDLPQPIRYRVTAIEDLQQARQSGRLWTATSGDGKVIGFAMADVVDDLAYLAELAVLPDFGRRGIGKRLVESVIAWACDSGFSTLRLVTFGHIPWNAPFYEKLGFSTVEPPAPGTEMAEIMEAERRAGIDKSRRVLMQLTL